MENAARFTTQGEQAGREDWLTPHIIKKIREKGNLVIRNGHGWIKLIFIKGVPIFIDWKESEKLNEIK